MSNEAQSATALRCLIRASVGSPGNPEDIANINTGNLPDGAQCFVTENRVLYRFRKFSTLAASGTVVIAPIAGGGRWVQEGPVAGALAYFAAATGENSTNSSDSGDWLPPQTSLFAVQLGTGLWTFNPSSCLATYNGPPATYLARVVATVTFTGPDTAYIGIDQDNDLAGTAAGFAQGAEFVDSQPASSESHILVSERLLVLAPGDVIGPRFRLGGGVDLIIERLTISAEAVQ